MNKEETKRVPCEHDNIKITLGGLRQCQECGVLLDQKKEGNDEKVCV